MCQSKELYINSRVHKSLPRQPKNKNLEKSIPSLFFLFFSFFLFFFLLLLFLHFHFFLLFFLLSFFLLSFFFSFFFPFFLLFYIFLFSFFFRFSFFLAFFSLFVSFFLLLFLLFMLFCVIFFFLLCFSYFHTLISSWVFTSFSLYHKCYGFERVFVPLTGVFYLNSFPTFGAWTIAIWFYQGFFKGASTSSLKVSGLSNVVQSTYLWWKV